MTDTTHTQLASPPRDGPMAQPPSRSTSTAMATLASRASATTVALIAGYSSYTHIAHVALHHGERAEVAYLLPFAIDGLLIVATTAMLDDKRHQRRVRWSARLAFTFGVTASLAANIASAQATLAARVVAAIPAVTLLLAIEVISRTGRPQDAATRRTGLAAATDDASATVVGRGSGRSVATAAIGGLPNTNGHRPTRARSGTVARTGSTATRRTSGVATAIRVAAVLAADPQADTATVADRLGVSARTARRHIAAYRTGAGRTRST